jgi:hypothetical protein
MIGCHTQWSRALTQLHCVVVPRLPLWLQASRVQRVASLLRLRRYGWICCDLHRVASSWLLARAPCTQQVCGCACVPAISHSRFASGRGLQCMHSENCECMSLQVLHRRCVHTAALPYLQKWQAQVASLITTFSIHSTMHTTNYCIRLCHSDTSQ